MKYLITFLRLTLLTLIALAIPARAQVTPTSLFQLTNLPPWIAGGATSNFFNPATNGIPVNNVISLRQGTGFSLILNFAGSNAASTGPLSLDLAMSADGTNWSTARSTNSGQTSFTQNANGATQVFTWTNFPAQAVNNMQYVAPLDLTNGCASTNGLFLTNGWISIANTTYSYP